MKLIDADELMDDVNNKIFDDWERAIFKSLIEQQPEVKAPFKAVAEIKIDEEKHRKICKEQLEMAAKQNPNVLQSNPEVEYSGWVPAKSEFPKRGQAVLVTKAGGNIGTAIFMGESYSDAWYSLDYNCVYAMNEIVAWRPLPEPYQGGDE